MLGNFNKPSSPFRVIEFKLKILALLRVCELNFAALVEVFSVPYTLKGEKTVHLQSVPDKKIIFLPTVNAVSKCQESSVWV